MLTTKDIEFLARKTKLNPNRAQSLFEEKEDGDLVLEELSKKRITKKEVLELLALTFKPGNLYGQQK